MEREKGGRAREREKTPIYSTVVQLQLRHECILNRRDRGGEVKREQACQPDVSGCDTESQIIRAHQRLYHLYLGAWICQTSFLRKTSLNIWRMHDWLSCVRALGFSYSSSFQIRLIARASLCAEIVNLGGDNLTRLFQRTLTVKGLRRTD